MHRSLGARINAAIVLIVTAVLAASGTYSYLSNRHALEAQYHLQQIARTNRLSDVLPALVWESDPKLNLLLDAEMASAELTGLRVYDGQTLVAARRRLDDGRVVPASEAEAIEGRRDVYPLKFAQHGATVDLGHFETFVSERPIHAALLAQVKAKITEIVVIDLVLVAALSIGLVMIVLRPLANLKRALELALTAESVELPESRNDELGEVVRGYNRIARKLADDLRRRREVEQELTVAKDAAERANRAKSHFLSRMSHELRTPLNAVIGFSQLLLSDRDPPLAARQLQQVAHIELAGRHLLEMIDEVMDVSRIDAGTLRLTLRPVDLGQEARAAVQLLEDRAVAGQVSVDVASTGELEPVLADPTRLRQVLLNLVGNAIKYTLPGGSVRVTLKREPDARLGFTVSDTGIGIDPDDLPQLFDPFNRLGQETSTRPGTGIGLVVTKGLVELMGGTLGVSSQAGVGSEFTVLLPAARAGEFPAAQRSMPLELARPEQASRVLYIEDNEVNVELVRSLFAARPQVTLVVSATGEDGLEQARRHPFDLILLDIHLPGLPGMEVLRELKRDRSTARVPVIVLSADAAAQSAAESLRAGAAAYLTKPLDLRSTLAKIDGVLRHEAAKAAGLDTHRGPAPDAALADAADRNAARTAR